MGLFERLDRLVGYRPEPQRKRAITPEDFGNGRDLFESGTSAQETVTVDSALGLMAVWGCVRLLVDDISTLPVDVYRATGDGGKIELPKPDWMRYPTLDENVTFTDHVAQAVFSYLVGGEVFIGGTPNTYTPDMVEVIPPGDVTVMEGGRYRIRGRSETFTANRIRHIRHIVKPGSLRGVNPITAAREGLALMQASERFGGTFFGNGAVMSGVIQVPREAGKMSVEETDRLREQFRRRHDAKRKSHAVGILTGGAQWQQLSFSPEDTQFLQLRKYQVEDIARLFGVPPFKLGSTEPGAVAYASTVQAAIEYVRTAVRPIVARLEAAYSSFIPGEDTYVKFNLLGLLRADPKARYDSYQVGLQSRFLKVDEVRALEDMEPFGDADGGGFLNTPNSVVVDPRVTEAVALINAGADPASTLAALGLPPIQWREQATAAPEPEVAA